ncbi:hypothetical protein GCM10010435_31600 [Winogradskya consettensis]|uniref:Uncharacterized protein n=1 Tax=Winogradskya consettensis TaxID=113560 RepID=A0A919SG34_9ACTN|nr:hypothetical protein Aco04nite_19900 [Actinoplanes consettensis]
MAPGDAGDASEAVAFTTPTANPVAATSAVAAAANNLRVRMGSLLGTGFLVLARFLGDRAEPGARGIWLSSAPFAAALSSATAVAGLSWVPLVAGLSLVFAVAGLSLVFAVAGLYLVFVVAGLSFVRVRIGLNFLRRGTG